MKECAATATTARETFREHGDNAREHVGARGEKGRGPPQHMKQLILAPFACTDFGDDLLSEHVERIFGDHQPIKLAAVDAIDKSCALDELVARHRKEPPFGRAI